MSVKIDIAESPVFWMECAALALLIGDKDGCEYYEEIALSCCE